jgi:ribosomal protein L7/L12
MTHVSIRDAYHTDSTGIEWHVRLEYVGGNSKNVSGVSTKFYEAGRDVSGYFIRYGKIGTSGACKRHPNAQAVMDQVAKKAAKGYCECPTTATTTTVPWIPTAPATPLAAPVDQVAFTDPTFDKCKAVRFDVLLMAGGLQNKKISAIKAVRTATRWGLKEAKNAVEGGSGSLLGKGLTRAQTHALRRDFSNAGYKTGWQESSDFSVDLSATGSVFGLVKYVRKVNGSWRGFNAQGQSLMAIPETLLH